MPTEIAEIKITVTSSNRRAEVQRGRGRQVASTELEWVKNYARSVLSQLEADEGYSVEIWPKVG